MMSEAAMVTIIVALLGSGIWGAAAQWRASRREAPVKQKDADLAAAQASQQITMALVEALREEVDRLGQSFKAERETRCQEVQAERDARERDIHRIQREREADRRELGSVRVALAQWTDWWQQLAENWEELRGSPSPPDPPEIDRY